jgi:hypothetical protein
VEGFDDEPVGAQHPDPVAVAGMELDAAARPRHPAQAPLRPQEPLLGEALVFRDAQGGQDAVGQEHQPAARAQQPGRLGDPTLRVAPDACTSALMM